MSSLAALLAVVVAVAVSGCGQSDKEQALDLARQACEVAPVAPGVTSTSDATAAETAQAYDESAGKAALAARLDPGWDRLSAAYVGLAESWGFIATLPLDAFGKYDRTRATAEQQSRLPSIAQRAMEQEGEIRAECRKATS